MRIYHSYTKELLTLKVSYERASLSWFGTFTRTQLMNTGHRSHIQIVKSAYKFVYTWSILMSFAPWWVQLFFWQFGINLLKWLLHFFWLIFISHLHVIINGTRTAPYTEIAGIIAKYMYRPVGPHNNFVIWLKACNQFLLFESQTGTFFCQLPSLISLFVATFWMLVVCMCFKCANTVVLKLIQIPYWVNVKLTNAPKKPF